MLLRVAIAGKARIAYHWVTEKKRNITLNNQRRSCNFDKLRKEESSLSFLLSGSKRKRGFTPKLRVEVTYPRGLGTTTIFPKSQPPWQGNRKREWSAQTEPPTVTKGTIHSTKIPTGKSGPPQKIDQFFRNFSGWAEPIHWVLDRNFQKFWSNGLPPKVLASKPASTFGSNGFNGAETNRGIARILSILLMNSCDT